MEARDIRRGLAMIQHHAEQHNIEMGPTTPIFGVVAQILNRHGIDAELGRDDPMWMMQQLRELELSGVIA